jgi:hypothetical protein
MYDPYVTGEPPNGIGWYVFGALAIVAIVAGFLYADGHFDNGVGAEATIERPLVLLPPANS